MLKPSRIRGDTLIEVMFSFTIFSFLAILAITVMNQGTATAERALEVTLVRQQIDGQAETLRSMRDQYANLIGTGGFVDNSNPAITTWEQGIIAKTVTSAQPFGAVNDKCPVIPSSAFIVNTHNGTLSGLTPKSSDAAGATPFAQLVFDPNSPTSLTDAYGIWVQAVSPIRSPATQTTENSFIDFHIQACWYGPGSGQAMTLGTIVRVYAPKRN